MDPSGRRRRHRPGRCGLVIEFLHEHPNDDHNQASSGVSPAPGARQAPQLPASYSVRAHLA